MIIKETIKIEPMSIYNLLKVNKFFQNTVCKIGLPRLYINPTFFYPVPRPVRVRRLIRVFGSGSGLLLRLREIIHKRGWSNAWLFLQEKDNFWYDVVWKK